MGDPPKLTRIPNPPPSGPARAPTSHELRMDQERARLGFGEHAASLRATSPSTPAQQAMELVRPPAGHPEFPRSDTETPRVPVFQQLGFGPLGKMPLGGSLPEGHGKGVPEKVRPGPEDVAASIVANRIRSGSDPELVTAFLDAKQIGNPAVLRGNILRVLGPGWDGYEPYVTDRILTAPSLESYSSPRSATGVDLDVVFDRMSERTAQAEAMLRAQGAKVKLDQKEPHLRVIELFRSTRAPMDEKMKLFAKPMGSLKDFVSTMRKVVAKDPSVFVPPATGSYTKRLSTVRTEEMNTLLPYEGPSGAGSVLAESGREQWVQLGRESEVQPQTRTWTPQESAGLALRDKLLLRDPNVPALWNELAQTWRFLPIDPESPLTPERQMFRIALQDADLAYGLSGDGMEMLARRAGFDTSPQAINNAINALDQIPFFPNDVRQYVEAAALLPEQHVAALAVAARHPDTYQVGAPELWAFGQRNSLGRAVTETIASGDDIKAGRVIRVASAIWPDEYHRISQADVGEYGEWQPGMYRAAGDAATELNRLSLRGPRAVGLVDPRFASGLARTSQQYVPDGVTPSRPPIRLEPGLDPNSPQLLSELEKLVAEPYPAFRDWLADPKTQGAIAGFSGSDAVKIQKAIAAGKIPAPIQADEVQSYYVRKHILSNMWKQVLDDFSDPNNPNKVVELQNRIQFWESLGINVPKTISGLLGDSGPVAMERARTAVGADSEIGSFFSSVSGDFE